MKILKIILAALLAVLVIISPVVMVFAGTLAIPAQYDHTFLGVLDEKFDRLTTLKDEKVVVIGGSSVAFGLDSRLLERYMNRPVVNFGLYADLGTKLMLDLSLAGVGEGDIVVIAPELDPQTMSMYFNSERTLQAMDGSYHMMAHVGSDNIFSLIGAMFAHLGRKIECLTQGAPKVEGVYQAQNFNTYGDIMYTRPGNVMENYYDRNSTIRLDESIIDGAFIEYLNDYVRKCESRGAKVYFSFCPMNRMALAKDTDSESITAFEAYLKRELDCELISYADDYIMDAGYFYDSNFHLNEKGARYRTLLLARDLLLAVGEPTLITTPLPEPPELVSGMIMVEGYDENQKYFTYEEMPNGNYKITGLTKLGMEQKELTIPISISIGDSNFGAAVTSVGGGAFRGSAATRVNIPKGSYVGLIENLVFEGSSVKELYVNIGAPDKIKPPSTQDGGFGNKTTLTVHVPENSGYVIDYFWSEVPKNVNISEDISRE